MASESDVPFDSEADESSELSILGYPKTRRKFIKQVAGTSAAIAIGPNLLSAASLDQTEAMRAAGPATGSVKVNLKINGKNYVLDERALHWMQLFAIGQTFYGRDLVAFMRDSETEAGIDAPPVHQNRARATLAVVASFLRAGEVQPLAQGVEQCDAWINVECVSLAVDLQVHVN